MIEFRNPPGATGLPFSQAVRVGEVLYLSGQLGNKPGTLELVEGEPPAGAHVETHTLDGEQVTLGVRRRS